MNDTPEAIIQRMLKTQRQIDRMGNRLRDGSQLVRTSPDQTYVRIDPDIPMISLFRALASEGLHFRFRGGELVIEAESRQGT